MYKLEDIINYEFTRDLILKNQKNQQVLTVFDDTDLTSDKFKFMKVGKTYDCKILLFARIQKYEKAYQRKAEKFKFIGKEQIGKYERLKIQDSQGNILYVNRDFENEIKNRKIYLIPLRYDILEVNNIVR
ncbi:hypothetical protein J2Z60_001104 [Lactobacillus colini]|uniref:Uncharacterized protein n=1 Tax=Lactobacillus colini TaxID=1819254 RepID=A0ABS4ME56_9LACO|nr:hypothetical protein [Lactobacillus colini]MBP2057929.1 hypothetical protein [Lactobacillus colini]